MVFDTIILGVGHKYVVAGISRQFRKRRTATAAGIDGVAIGEFRRPGLFGLIPNTQGRYSGCPRVLIATQINACGQVGQLMECDVNPM